jgi:hypothetical protein
MGFNFIFLSVATSPQKPTKICLRKGTSKLPRGEAAAVHALQKDKRAPAFKMFHFHISLGEPDGLRESICF